MRYVFLVTLRNYVHQFSLSFFLDFPHRLPPPVSYHFVVYQRWSLTRELTVQVMISAASLQPACIHAQFTHCVRFARDEIIKSLCLALRGE